MKPAECLAVALFLCSSTLGAGCSHPESTGTTVLPTATQAADAQDWHAAEDLLSARMRSIAEGLAVTGYAPAEFAQRGFLAGGARATHELLAPAGRCLTVVALAATGIADLDASIFEADGHAVSQDAASDARPVLRACAGDEPRRLYYVLHAFSGSGAYLVASFEGPLEGAGSSELSTLDAGPASHADWTAALVRRGFEPEGPPVELSVTPESQVRVALPARVGQCVALVAFAAEGDTDVNLWLADEAGVDRVRDDASRAWAGVQLCPDSSGVFTARVSVRGEAGRVMVGRFAGRASRVGGERAMWLGEVVAAHGMGGEQDAAKAAETRVPAAAGSLVAGAVEQRSVRLPSAPCTALSVELGDGLSSVAVRVISEAGERLRSVTLSDHDVAVHLCGHAGRRVHVQVEARRGVGDYALEARPVEARAASFVSHAPDGVAARMLDLLEVARRRGWPGLRVERLAPTALRCDGALGCVWARTRAVESGHCLSGALLDARGEPLPLTLRTPGVTDARARGGFTTRCAHGGEVELRTEPNRRPSGELFLLQVEHEGVR